VKNALSENKYYKVLIASQRARQLEKGARPLVQVEKTKTTSVALAEVERDLIGFDFIRDRQKISTSQE
jgi:DNA-directed RNA polymerase omega subunit